MHSIFRVCLLSYRPWKVCVPPIVSLYIDAVYPIRTHTLCRRCYLYYRHRKVCVPLYPCAVLILRTHTQFGESVMQAWESVCPYVCPYAAYLVSMKAVCRVYLTVLQALESVCSFVSLSSIPVLPLKDAYSLWSRKTVFRPLSFSSCFSVFICSISPKDAHSMQNMLIVLQV